MDSSLIPTHCEKLTAVILGSLILWATGCAQCPWLTAMGSVPPVVLMSASISLASNSRFPRIKIYTVLINYALHLACFILTLCFVTVGRRFAIVKAELNYSITKTCSSESDHQII